MDEGYLCNTCRIGKVRPIHFSLKQAIVNCDNAECDSYLDKWPWECIVTKPILDSSDLSKYERESVCSSDSSGVHSDLGNSSHSQFSVTDREVENLFYKAGGNKFQPVNHLKKEEISKSHQSWPFGYENQNQEPFMALDNIFTASNEMSTSDQTIASNNVSGRGICNEVDSDYVKNCDFFELLKEASSTEAYTENRYNSNTPVNKLDNFETWLEEFDLGKGNESNQVNSRPFENGKSAPQQSPSKALIPSVNSAFYEVSPSKINQNKANLNTHSEDRKEDGNGERAKPSMPNFMSPASSGFSDDYNFNGDLVTNKPSTLNESFSLSSNISHPTASCESKTQSSGNEISENSSETRTEYEVSPFEMVTSCENHVSSDDGGKEKNVILNKNLHYTNNNGETNASLNFQSSEINLNLESLSFEEVNKKFDLPKKISSDENLQRKTPSTPQCDSRSGSMFSSFEPQLISEFSSSEANFDSAEPVPSESNINSACCTPTFSESLETTSSVTTSQSGKENDNGDIGQLIEILPAVNKSTIVSKRGRPRKSHNSTSQKVLKNDPWSIPEMYLDELNIEVVVGDSSSGNECNNDNLSGSRLSSGNLVKIENGHSVTPVENVRRISPAENAQSILPTANAGSVPPLQIVVHPKPITTEGFPSENFRASSTPKVDLYKPVTLKPEVIDSPSVSYFDAALNIGTPSNVRYSVGYGGDDSQDQIDRSSSVKEMDSRDISSSRSRQYLSSILSSMDFDENFSLIGKQESERSLEDSFSINYMNFESDAESTIPEDHHENKNQTSNSENCNDEEQNPETENIKIESTLHNNLDETICEDSDTDIPIVTIDVDDNDELKLFIPIKKEVKLETDDEDFSSHNLRNIKESYSTNKMRKKHEKGLKDYSGMRPPIGEIDTKNTLSRPSSYNVKRENFLMLSKQFNFGNIKKEPEYLESLSNELDCSDRYDLGEYSSSSDYQFELLEDNIKIKEELFDMLPPQKIKKGKCRSPPKEYKSERCREVLKPHSYMNRVIGSVNEYDTAWSKPYSNLPSIQKLKNKLNKNEFQKDQFRNTVQSLEKNPSVPDVLKLLSEAGWAVMPCNPTINYNVPEHAISPTIVPTALQSQYGHMGSDLVYWSLTDKDVPGPVKEEENRISNKNYEANILKYDYKNNLKRKNNFKTKLSKKFATKLLNENSKSRDLFSGRQVNKYRKINPDETQLTSNQYSSIKSCKAKYLADSQPLQQNYRSESNSDECIELPDDLLAYEEAKRRGFNVSAPLIRTENIYIPPPSPRKYIRRTPPPPPTPSPTPSPSPPPSKENLTPLLKSHDELKSIVTDRPPKEVPNVVCMNIDGKLYVYHRKDT